MSATLVALVGFATWTLLLVFSLAGLRVVYARRTGKDLNTFAPDGSDMDTLGQRWTRAHLNCVETLPPFAAIALAAVASGNAAVTDPLALPFLLLRLAQSTVHLISTSVPFVLIRATLFGVQVLILLRWAFGLLTA